MKEQIIKIQQLESKVNTKYNKKDLLPSSKEQSLEESYRLVQENRDMKNKQRKTEMEMGSLSAKLDGKDKVIENLIDENQLLKDQVEQF